LGSRRKSRLIQAGASRLERVRVDRSVADLFSIAVEDREELVIALIGAIGTNLGVANAILQEMVGTYGYDSRIVKVSDVIRTFPPYDAVKKSGDYDYYRRMIEGGNYVCDAFDDNAALAQLSIGEIAIKRAEMADGQRRAYIVDSLKRPEEVRLLRETYGSLFYAVGIYADPSTREKRLTRKINARLGKADEPEGRYDAQRLMRIDENEENSHGQKVSDTFAQADYFVRSDDDAEMRRALGRLLTLIFRKPYISPTRAEVAMMHGYSAGLRSADLSRQIGAVITSRDGRILTTGCNEVPRPGGGQYWESDLDDQRDFKIGRDMNDVKKKDTIVEMLRLLDSVIIPENYVDGIEPLYAEITTRKLLSGSRVDSLIEFGRVLHAEMSALNGALLDNLSVRDSDVFCTTFPCHMCTRLIIGAGIRNVFYIEPYPKSAALELYGETEIRVNPTLTPKAYLARQSAVEIDDRRTYFLPFEGVAPRRYQDLFSNGKQKNPDGSILGFEPLVAKPRKIPSYVATHILIEWEIARRVASRAAELRKGRSQVAPQPPSAPPPA
jgi:deoxycytidylate deaminase